MGQREITEIPGAVFPAEWLPLHTLARLGWLSPDEAAELRKELECLRGSDSTSSPPQSNS